MAYETLSENSATEEQMSIIRQCIEKLSVMGEVERIRKLGISVNGLLFNADQDYRREVIYRVAKLVQPHDFDTENYFYCQLHLGAIRR